MRPVELDFKAAKKKITKKLKVTRDLLTLSHNIKHEIELNKSIVQLMNEQIISNKQSNWKGYDIIFYIPITSKKRSLRDRSSSVAMSPSASNTAANSGSSSNQSKLHERHLFLLRKPDSSKDLYFVKVINKENELDIKNIYDVKSFRGIDYGSDELELVLSLEAGDYSLYFLNLTDRDEFTWIVSQLGKTIVGNEFSIGFSVDVEALSYMMATSTVFTKFPQLNKVISLQNMQFGYQFSTDEAEAEHILDELNWSNSVTSLNDIHNALNNKSTKLNDEIIDFLLQWEEMDYANLAKGNNKNNSTALNSSVRQVIQPKTELTSSLRDTGEVLVALAHVDRELSSVELWLDEQINHLSEIQSNLFAIEDESASLETAWQSLNRVQEIITFLMQKYTLTEQQEKLLKNPDLALNPILKSPTLNSHSLYNNNLAPLYNAVKVLRNALVIKISSELYGLKASEWKQIQAISAISTQKAKLQEISEIFCNKFGDIATGLFDWLLKHRSLVEGDDHLPSAIPKSFTSKTLIDDIHFAKVSSTPNSSEANSSRSVRSSIYAPTGTSNDSNSATTNNGNPPPSGLINTNRFRFPKNNQLLQSQGIFHIYLSKFSPILDILIELSPKYIKILSDSYRNAVHERFYSPLIKAFVKDIRNSITYLQPPINLNNCKGFHFHSKNDVMVSFSRGTTKQITSWKVLEVALLLLSPLIENEEAFLKKLFNLAEKSEYDEELEAGVIFQEQNEGRPSLEDLMNAIFDTVFKRLTSISASSVLNSSNASETDGIEAIALLSVLQQFLTSFMESLNSLNSSPNPPSSNLALDTTNTNNNNNAGKDANNQNNNNTSPTLANTAASRSQLIKRPSIYQELNPSSYMDPESQLYVLRTVNNRVFLFKLFDSLKEYFEQRINAFMNEQIKWINAQKADPKSPNVLLPFYRFPTLIMQIIEMCNGERFDCVDDLIQRLAKEMISWLNTVTKQSDKYADKMKIINYLFFHISMTSLMNQHHHLAISLNILQPFLNYSLQQVSECSQRYLHWMIEYEFASLSALATRLDGVGSRVNDEELSLYIRRKDVLNVIKEMESKTLETMVVNLKKRLEKHFRSEFDSGGLNLTGKMWEELKERMVNILTKLDTAATVSYQIKLDVGPKNLLDLFEKHKP